MAIKFKMCTVVFATVLSFSSCNNHHSSVKNNTPDEFEKGISQASAQLVDVSSPKEYNEKHISHSVNININDGGFYKQMENRIDKLKPVYIYSISGIRSNDAAQWAVKNDYKEVYNLEGGLKAWIEAGKPVTNVSTNSSLSEMSFEEYLIAIKRNDKLVLVDFNAVWCAPCKLLKPIVTEIMKKYNSEVELLEIDVDKNPMVAANMNVSGIPMLLLYKEGKEVWRNMGLVEKDSLEEKFKEFSK